MASGWPADTASALLHTVPESPEVPMVTRHHGIFTRHASIGGHQAPSAHPPHCGDDSVVTRSARDAAPVCFSLALNAAPELVSDLRRTMVVASRPAASGAGAGGQRIRDSEQRPRALYGSESFFTRVCAPERYGRRVILSGGGGVAASGAGAAGGGLLLHAARQEHRRSAAARMGAPTAAPRAPACARAHAPRAGGGARGHAGHC